MNRGDESEVLLNLCLVCDHFNRSYFGGALVTPLLVIASTSPRAVATRDELGGRPVVRLHPTKAFARGLLFAEDVLLHEMIHLWQSQILGEEERGYRGHGPHFARKCNEIGRAIALADVGVKGRKGLPDCAHWPGCVRPDGYYLPAPPARARAEVVLVDVDGDRDALELALRASRPVGRLEATAAERATLRAAAAVLRKLGALEP